MKIWCSFAKNRSIYKIIIINNTDYHTIVFQTLFKQILRPFSCGPFLSFTVDDFETTAYEPPLNGGDEIFLSPERPGGQTKAAHVCTTVVRGVPRASPPCAPILCARALFPNGPCLMFYWPIYKSRHLSFRKQSVKLIFSSLVGTFFHHGSPLVPEDIDNVNQQQQQQRWKWI